MKKIKNKKGTALAYALVIMAICMIILTSMLGYIVSQLKFSVNRTEKAQALNVAEAGVYWYRWYLAHQLAGKTAEQINTFWQSGTALGVGGTAYEKDYVNSVGVAIGHYEISVQQPASDSTIATVTSVGWTKKSPNTKRTVQVRFRRPSWSEYAVLANDIIRFGEGTDVYGKIHSNKGIRFDGTAHNIVSSLLSQYQDPDHASGPEFGVHTHVNAPPASGTNDSYRSAEAPPGIPPARTDVFEAGRQFPVPEVSFNGVLSDLSFMKTQSQNPAHGKYFDNSDSDRQIVLKTDGNYDVYTVKTYANTSSNAITGYAGTTKSDGTGTVCTISASASSGPNTFCINKTSSPKCYCKKETYAIPNSGVIFVEDNLWLEGTIANKKVTIVAANLSGGTQADVFVGNNNILYTNLDGKDILGVIAQNDIEVIKNSQNILVLDGAFLAQGGRVGRANYGSSDHKSSITMNGSMATNLRYGFAWTSGSNDWGYDIRNLNFDNNLVYFPPPYFPTGTQYSIDQWQEL